MGANELMIGDWVNEIFVGFHQWDITDYPDFDEKYITPIPLTAEILEKNGFRKFGEKYEWEDHIWIQRWKSYSAVGFTILDVSGYGFEWEGKSIRNVHLLQHALRLCGLTDMADNFKI